MPVLDRAAPWGPILPLKVVHGASDGSSKSKLPSRWPEHAVVVGGSTRKVNQPLPIAATLSVAVTFTTQVPAVSLSRAPDT